ncbi:DNA-3-methyladenine glycosylase-like isoform X2 [Rhodnius prolixus]|uniref:DNA-3-methyladenine glycosylase-like isoform X2 n=1 Tax=Rhodnius prolixus TaxID=13249 RepID=UPI003D18F9CC
MTLVRRLDHERRLKCRIVETEAYLGGEDKAAHSNATNRPTKKTNSCFMNPGTACVTSIYGVHLMLSISSLENGASVLLRAAEPISGAMEMKRQRALRFQNNISNPLSTIRDLRLHRLCAGPAKLTRALIIGSEFDGNDLTTSNKLWLEEGPEIVAESQIVECPRVGLSISAGEWAEKPLRYYILGHTSVSQRHKDCEKKLLIASGVLSEDGKLFLE